MKPALLFFCLLIGNISYSQSTEIKPLSIGDIVPAKIWKSISKKKDNKLIILDFWYTRCHTCVANFPKLEKLQQEFKGKLQIVLVNWCENDLQVKERMQKINGIRKINGENLIVIPNMPAINGDTVLHKLFPYSGMPLHVWIKGNGEVLAITSDYNATPEHIQAVLNNENITLSILRDHIDYDIINKVGIFKPSDSKFLPAYYSGFLRYSPDIDGWGIYKDSTTHIVRQHFANMNVLDLYRMAFRVYETGIRMVIELTDKEKYQLPKDDNKKDKWQEENLFSYELCVPFKDEAKMDGYMQQDMNRFFGNLFNIVGGIEKRKYKSFVLIQTKQNLLKTNGGVRSSKLTDSSIVWTNIPFRDIVIGLRYKIEDINAGRLFIDETGINGNVDMQLIGDISNIDNLRNQLQEYGLEIIEGEREVEVLVIRGG